MSRISRFAMLAAVTALAGCGDHTSPILPSSESSPTGAPVPVSRPAADEAATRERLARRVARALGSASFRAYVKSQLEASPVREHKLQLQRFIGAADRRALRELARAGGEPEAAVEGDARRAIPLEMYLPVPEHRARWAGGENILVATEREERETPVAYDTKGRRHLLSPDAPPDTPVLAIVPVETDFDHPSSPAPFICCAGGGPTAPAGLYMTASHFVQDFEGWLKGSSEYEIHILGQNGASDSLTSYQCAGEHAGGYYAFDQNALDWSGSVLLFTQAQLSAYKTAHPGQNFRIVAFEDDDGACQIRLDGNRFKAFQNALQSAYASLTGSKDTTSGLVKVVKRANALQKILRAAYSFITSQDDLIGNAIEDVVTGEVHPGFNWTIKGESNVTNGWIKLQMK